jgi:hypothetical protein
MIVQEIEPSTSGLLDHSAVDIIIVLLLLLSSKIVGFNFYLELGESWCKPDRNAYKIYIHETEQKWEQPSNEQIALLNQRILIIRSG